MATQLEYAWAAGFFDGEGCVSIRKSVDARSYSVSIIVVQKDRRPIDHFRAIFGYERKVSIVHRNVHKRDYYRFTLCGREAAEALKCMLPYLILKREVTLVALDVQASVERTPAGKTDRIPVRELELRESLHRQAKWLNSGRWATTTTKPSGSVETQGCDSLNSRDEKAGEVAETTTRLN